MRIMINALSTKGGGGLTYLLELIKHLSMISSEVDVNILTSPQNYREFNEVANNEPAFSDRIHLVQTKVGNLIQRLLYEQLLLPFQLRKLNIDLLYSPAEVATFFSNIPQVVGVQNPNLYYDIPVERTWIEKFRLKALKRLSNFSLLKADKVIAVSNTFRLKVAEETSVNKGKLVPIPHGVDSHKFGKNISVGSDELLEEYGLEKERYFLCVANMHKHKNIGSLIEAYKKLDSELKKRYKLVIVGRKTSYFHEHLKELVPAQLKERIIFTGEIDYSKVGQFYQDAFLFVLPSWLETFGIPLIEAMKSKTPVIGANSTSIPEVVGDAGLLFEPDDPEELSEKITQIATNKRLRKELIEKGEERAHKFTWEKTARETLKVFRSLIKD